MCARARVRERVRVRVCMHVTMSVRKPALFWRRAEANNKGHATFGQHPIAHDASDASVAVGEGVDVHEHQKYESATNFGANVVARDARRMCGDHSVGGLAQEYQFRTH